MFELVRRLARITSYAYLISCSPQIDLAVIERYRRKGVSKRVGLVVKTTLGRVVAAWRSLCKQASARKGAANRFLQKIDRTAIHRAFQGWSSYLLKRKRASRITERLASERRIAAQRLAIGWMVTVARARRRAKRIMIFMRSALSGVRQYSLFFQCWCFLFFRKKKREAVLTDVFSAWHLWARNMRKTAVS